MSITKSLLLIALVSLVSMDGVFAANVALEKNKEAASKAPAKIQGKAGVRDYRSEVGSELQKLVSLSRRASFKLRRSIATLKERGIDTSAYNNLANKYDEFAVFVNKKQMAVSSGSKTYTSSDVQSIRDVSEDTQDGMDKMGNFDVQEMMSRATQARNLASSVQKDLDKSKEAIMGKIGGGSDDSDDPDD